MVQHRILRLIPVAFLIAPLASCSSSQPDRGSIAVVPAFTVVGHNLPLGWFIEDEARVRRRIGNASAKLLEQCLRDRGFEVKVPVRPESTADHLSERYGLVSEDQARRYGYSSPEATESEGFEQPSYPQNNSQFDAAFDGGAKTPVPVTSPVDGGKIGEVIRPGGCNGEVIDKLFGNFDAYVSYNAFEIWLQQKEAETLDTAKSAPSVLASAEEWSRCMALSGYAFSQPDDAAANAWSDKETEIRTALVDVRCRQTSGYLETLIAADVSAQQSVVSQFPELRADYESLLHAIDADFS